MTWRNTMAACRQRKAEELAVNLRGLDNIWFLEAGIASDLPAGVAAFVSGFFGQLGEKLVDWLDADKGVIVHSGKSVVILVVDLDAEVISRPHASVPGATWYPAVLPGQVWIGDRDEQPVAAHLVAYAAGVDQAMDRGRLRGSEA